MSKFVSGLDAALTGQGRLSYLLVWTWIVMAHVALLALALALLWACQVPPQVALQVLLDFQKLPLVGALLAIGIGVGVPAAVYWWLVRHGAAAIDLRVRKYLYKDL